MTLLTKTKLLSDFNQSASVHLDKLVVRQVELINFELSTT